ncbi:MAG TPA: flagellar export chaperone FliS [Nocardioides sp.]|nr:flagellar export chaperone FliS [Nocardioides sp.]
MNSTARSTYMGASVATASPARLLVMLCDRLVLDVRRALDAQLEGRPAEANQQLLHAQEIVLELRSSLREDAFDGATQLGRIYDFLLSELVRANMRKDGEDTRRCLQLTEQLCETWREAALNAAVS